MKNRSTTILIVLMALALTGVIVVQYFWINRSLSEKKELIDNKVYQAVSNVEQQLNDKHALAFYHTSSDFEFTDSDSMVFIHKMDDETFNPDSISASMEIHVISTDSEYTEISTVRSLDTVRELKIELKEIQNELDQLNEVRNVFEKIRFELKDSLADLRLDSAVIFNHLSKELASANLGEPGNWGVFDSQKKKYIIQPKKQVDFIYDIPIYKNDVLFPGRYSIHLNLKDQDKLVRGGLWTMILLSFLFMSIILTAFIIAIKLVIRHKRISQIKSDFINNMTHEFKTPLASISLAADSIVHPNVINNPDEIKRFIGLIREEKSNLNFQVERILEVAALAKGSLEIPKETVELVPIIESSIEKIQLLLNSKEGKIDFHSEDHPIIEVNKFHMENVIGNLLENSIKYSDNKPEIRIEVKSENDDVLITIADKGIGMTKEQQKKAFENFYRAETGNIHNTKGFGLGLSYSKLMIEKFGGTIEIDSKPKLGTTIMIKLPLSR